MLIINIQKCGIIGCGFVGSSTAFALVESGIFSEMVLIDTNKAKSEGEAMDLSHSVPFSKPMKILAGDYSDLVDCSVIIITAGAAQKPDESRTDLVNKNVEILKSIIPNIVRFNKSAVLLMVSNPVDILTYAAWKLSGLPKNQVIGSGTVLDTARLKFLLGEHLNIDARSVHAFIIGEHGDSELAVWSSANISGINLDGFCESCNSCKNMIKMQDLYLEVRDSAYSVIEKKGATYYAIAMAVRKIAECIVRDEHSVLPISVVLEGSYGLTDVCLGIPSIVGSHGVEKILDIPLNSDEREKLESSAKTLKKILDEISYG